MGKGCQKIQASSDKILSSGHVMYTIIIDNNMILHSCQLLRKYMDLKISHHNKNSFNYVWWWVFGRHDAHFAGCTNMESYVVYLKWI